MPIAKINTAGVFPDHIYSGRVAGDDIGPAEGKAVPRGSIRMR